MDWREGRAQPPLRLTMGNPTSEPEVAKLTVDGNQLKEIRYPAAWPRIEGYALQRLAIDVDLA